jgi:hypothetical protein
VITKTGIRLFRSGGEVADKACEQACSSPLKHVWREYIPCGQVTHDGHPVIAAKCRNLSRLPVIKKALPKYNNLDRDMISKTWAKVVNGE